MSKTKLTAQKSLNKVYRKVKLVRKDIDLFKVNLIAMLDNVKESESEEFHKNLIIDFEELENLSTEIIGNQDNKLLVKSLESQIDHLVYKLYCSTYTEVLMVEASVGNGSFGMTGAEWDTLQI